MANVTFQLGVVGMGHDTDNTAKVGTRLPFAEFTSDKGMQQACDIASEIIEPEASEILKLQGITKVCCYASQGDSYDLWLRKGMAFSWDELTPKIAEILERRHIRLAYPSGDTHEDEIRDAENNHGQDSYGVDLQDTRETMRG
jgi:hypothetical protein